MSALPVDTDDEVIQQARSGDLDAFNILVDRYQDALFALCYRFLGYREAAEDATQEAFLSAYRALPGFAGGSVRSWLLRIAANAAKDELRRRSRKDVAISIQAEDEFREGGFDVPDPQADVAGVAERADVTRLVRQAIDTLPPDQRIVVLLVDIQGMDYQQACEIAGASLGTLKSRLNRARLRLRQHFSQNPELLDAYRRLDT